MYKVFTVLLKLFKVRFLEPPTHLGRIPFAERSYYINEVNMHFKDYMLVRPSKIRSFEQLTDQAFECWDCMDKRNWAVDYLHNWNNSLGALLHFDHKTHQKMEEGLHVNQNDDTPWSFLCPKFTSRLYVMLYRGKGVLIY